jgi:hypothetical protein
MQNVMLQSCILCSGVIFKTRRIPERHWPWHSWKIEMQLKRGSANDKGPRIASNRHSVVGLVGGVPRMLQYLEGMGANVNCGNVTKLN